MDDNKASRSVIAEILQNVVTGQSAAEPTGKGSENTSVYCGKTKVFMANSVVRVPLPQLTVLEYTCALCYQYSHRFSMDYSFPCFSLAASATLTGLNRSFFVKYKEGTLHFYTEGCSYLKKQTCKTKQQKNQLSFSRASFKPAATVTSGVCFPPHNTFSPSDTSAFYLNLTYYI